MEFSVKRSLLLILLACSIINPAAFAGQKQQQASGRATTQSGAAAAAAPQPQTKFVNRQLANGLEMIVVEDHSIPLVTCELAVRNGSYTDPPE
jgi:hypothetical protein